METSWGEFAALFTPGDTEKEANIGGLTEWRVINQKDKGVCDLQASGYYVFGKPPDVCRVKFFTRQENELLILGEEDYRFNWPENHITDGKLQQSFITAVINISAGSL